MRRSPLFVLSILAILSSSCAKAPAPEPARDTSADEAAIRGKTDTFLAAFNAADIAALETSVMEDAVEMREGGPELVGKRAIMAEAAKPFENNTMKQTATVDEVAVWGDVGMSRGTWEITQTPKAPGGTPVVTRGKWLVLHKRAADGSWMDWRHIWNMDPSPAGERNWDRPNASSPVGWQPRRSTPTRRWSAAALRRVREHRRPAGDASGIAMSIPPPAHRRGL